VRALGLAAAVLLTASLLIAMLVRRMAAPMRALAQVADAAAAGQFDQRAPEAGPRELAGVAQQFNRMLDRLPVLERELRESEARHRTLLEKLSHNIPGMIFQLRLEADGRSTLPFASDAIERMFEASPQQVRADAGPMFERIHPDDAPVVRSALAEAGAQLAPLAVEYRVLLAGGRVRHYLTYAHPERDDGGQLWHGCTVDVTTLKQTQLALRQANERLEARVEERTRALAAANELLEGFSYSIAHDLRAPLQAIEGFAEALPELVERADPARLQRLVQRIAANTAQMGRMIDGLLAVARAGKGQLVEERIELAGMVRDVLAELQVPASTQVQVGPLPAVRVDPASLRQVWWNLLANALKFTRRRSDARIEVGSERRGADLVFWVRDNGAGFDPAYAGRLFTAFQRLHEASDYEGTGIGLALARRVVERHGGRIWAEGQPDEGATFWFSLPASRAA
jgi:signal transduction histidine kinase